MREERRSLLIGGDARAHLLVGSIKRLLIERRSEGDVRANESIVYPRLPVSRCPRADAAIKFQR